MSQDSAKVLETKAKIKDAFFDLYAEKKIERISIKEITDKAKLNRGTFYVYYKDIYDLLEKIENEFLEELVDKIKGAATMILRDEDIFSFLPPLSFYQRYQKYLRALLGSNGDIHFVHKLKSIVKETLMELMKQEHFHIVPHIDYILEYTASAQVGLISYWLERDLELSIEELGVLIKEFFLRGPVGYVKSESAKWQESGDV